MADAGHGSPTTSTTESTPPQVGHAVASTRNTCRSRSAHAHRSTRDDRGRHDSVRLAPACVEYTNFERVPAVEPTTCTIVDDSFLSAWDPTREVAQGRAVAIVSLGSDSTVENERRVVVAGAPGRDDDDLQGTIRAHVADLTTGRVPVATPSALPNPSGTRRQLGAALHAADVKRCGVEAATGRRIACGEELLAGAPDRLTHTTGGRAFFYESDPALSNVGLRLGGEIPFPSALTKGASDEFGASFAAPRRSPPLSEPWLVAPDEASWVAVGAPGRQAVIVYFDLDPTAPDPFTAADAAGTTVELTWGEANFGYAMVAGDFDGDGLDDLAVGSPGPVPRDPALGGVFGSVVMFWGTTDPGATFFPFEDPLLEVNFNNVNPMVSGYGVGGGVTLSNPWLENDMFTDALPCPAAGLPPAECANGGGTALAAGRVLLDDVRDVLYVGYPGHSQRDGHVCQFVFTADRDRDSRTVCFWHPFDGRLNSFEFGYAVAVADFSPVDTWGDAYSAEGRLAELAVSSPAATRDFSAQGVVDVFATPNGVDPETLLRDDLIDHQAPVADGRFGAAVGVGYVHAAPWADLVVGAPDRATNRGNATLTVAANPEECPGEVEGKWTVLDTAGVAQEVHTFNHATADAFVIRFATGFRFEIRDTSGALCTSTEEPSFTGVVDLPPSAQVFTDSRWVCGAGSTSWTHQDSRTFANVLLQSLGIDNRTIDLELDVTVTNAGPGAATLSLQFAKLPRAALGLDASCVLDPSGPFTMTLDRPICESP